MNIVRRSTVIAAVAASLTATTPVPTGAAGVVTPTKDASALALTLAADPSWITGAELVTSPEGSTAGIVSGSIAGFPTAAGEAIILSTGDATILTDPNDYGSAGLNLGGPSIRGDSDRDVTILRIDLEVPDGTNCLAGIDFRFLSEEYPEYVGSPYNDAFIAEIDQSTWTTQSNTISAPNNFAFDPSGSEISINASGVTSFSEEGGAGTTFDGGTPALTAASPITPGAHSLYLSIFDQGDGVYDSAVIIDNLRFSFVADPLVDCVPGAKLVEPGDGNEGDAICADAVPTIIGTDGNDLLLGTPGDDVISGLGGDDRLLGFAGNDILCGGPGNDELRGNTGNDLLSGGEGNDRIFGEAGIDRAWGGVGDDVLDGGTQTDVSSGGTGDDVLRGGAEADVLSGGDGHDTLHGGTQDDVLDGNGGDDRLTGDAGDDRLDGGAGSNVLNGSTGNDVCVNGSSSIHCESSN